MRATVIEIVEALNRGGQMTAAEIVEATKMNVDTVRDALAKLKEAGWVHQCGFKSRVPGKKRAAAWKSAVSRSGE